MPPDPHMDRQRLLDLNRTEHDFLRRAVDALPDAQKLQPGVLGDWTVKDILAHVAAWEGRFLSWVEAAEQGERPERPAGGYTPADIDRINAEIYAASRDLSLPDVLAAFERSFHVFQSRLAALPEATLLEGGHFSFTGEHPLWRFAAANGYEHYREHAEAIRRWASAQG